MTVSWRRGALLLVVLALVVIPLADLALGPDDALNGSYALAALIAATVVSPRATAAVAAVAIALSFASPLWNTGVDDTEWLVRFALAVALSVIAVWVAALRVRRERDLRHMTLIAETAQRALLRSAPERVAGVSFAARYLSATRAAQVGGDLYDVASSPYGVRVVVGDVRGKGLDGVELAGTVLKAFRRAAPIEPSLTGLVSTLDAVVTAIAGEEEFVTAVVVELRPDRTIAVVSCGHPPPVLADESGTGTPLVTEPTTPLGLDPHPAEMAYPWPSGARLLLYTDGLVEARDADGEFFALDDHLDTLTATDLDDALDGLVAEAVEHAGGAIQDDLAVILAEQR